jgi:hypothetical protein
MSLGVGTGDGGGTSGGATGAGGGSGDGGSAGTTTTGAAATGGNGGGGSGASGGASGTSTSGNSQSGGMGGGVQTPAPSWRDGFSDDLKNDPTLSKYSDVQNLAKAHVELQKKIGQKGVFKPGKDASPDEIKSFRESMGIPTDPTKYDMGAFEGVKASPELLQWAQKVGTEQGIEPAALKAVITDYMKIEANNQVIAKKVSDDAAKAALDGLKKEWGDTFDRNIQRANFAAEKIGGKELVERLVKLNVHNDPALIKAFAEAAKLYGEDKLREGGVGDGRQTPQELDAEIASVQSRMFSMKPSDGAYLGLKARYESLWKMKTGGR